MPSHERQPKSRLPEPFHHTVLQIPAILRMALQVTVVLNERNCVVQAPLRFLILLALNVPLNTREVNQKWGWWINAMAKVGRREQWDNLAER